MASISVSNSIIVNAPIDKVFYIGTDPERQKEWMSNDDELRGYTPPVEVGSTFETVSKFMGREVVVSNEVVVNDAPHRCDYAMSGTMNGIIEHHFEETDGGVKVTIVLNGEMGGVLGAIAVPLLKGQVDNQIKKDLAKLKTYLEA